MFFSFLALVIMDKNLLSINWQNFPVLIMQLIDQHKDVLDKAKCDYEKLKKTVDELRASEVLLCLPFF